MIEKYHLRPTINVTEISQIKIITIKTVSQETTTLQIEAVKWGNYGNTSNFQDNSNYGIRYHDNYNKKGTQEIINNHRIIPIPGEMSHMMKSIQKKILSG